ncbi:Retrovirus-related Pol polyprotein from transposon gypsy [Dictyocoela muelleri]|nr:Retrovirus-related Pol polyprotein from transposon gypsy [Dictyocoela muelleri]
MKYFSILDLKDGYLQVPLHDDDKEKTTFLDHDNRLMMFSKMPQRFKKIPSIFQRGMSIILEGLIGFKCLIYIAVILIFGINKDDHKKILRFSKRGIRKYNLVAN